MMARMAARGTKIIVNLKMEAQNLPPVISRNTVAEIKGSVYPEQVSAFQNLKSCLSFSFRLGQLAPIQQCWIGASHVTVKVQQVTSERSFVDNVAWSNTEEFIWKIFKVELGSIWCFELDWFKFLCHAACSSPHKRLFLLNDSSGLLFLSNHLLFSVYKLFPKASITNLIPLVVKTIPRFVFCILILQPPGPTLATKGIPKK